MKVCIATDVNLLVYNGKYYLPTQLSSIIMRYYNTFGPLVFCSRKIVLDTFDDGYVEVTEAIADTVTAASLGEVFSASYRSALYKAVQKADLVIVRCPGLISQQAATYARKNHVPYFAEVMGCGWDAYWNHSLVGKVMAPYVYSQMKKALRHADYALYVTNEFLQKRYPCKNPSIGASNVLIQEIDERILEKRIAKIKAMNPKEVTLMTTAAVDVRYKGQEYVIKAIPLLNQVGIKVKYVLVGGGSPAYLQSVAKACGVEKQVEFLGRKTLSEVFSLLDEADIYIQPSLQEGLPRSVIEAMSRACPTIGARTAGIPELMADRCVVRRKSVKDIANTVQAIYNTEDMQLLALENFRNAKQYQEAVLSQKRNAYYETIIKELNQ